MDEIFKDIIDWRKLDLRLLSLGYVYYFFQYMIWTIKYGARDENFLEKWTETNPWLARQEFSPVVTSAFLIFATMICPVVAVTLWIGLWYGVAAAFALSAIEVYRGAVYYPSVDIKEALKHLTVHPLLVGWLGMWLWNWLE